MSEIASYELLCVKISSVVFPVEDGKKKGKERLQKVTGVIFDLFMGKPPVKKI